MEKQLQVLLVPCLLIHLSFRSTCKWRNSCDVEQHSNSPTHRIKTRRQVQNNTLSKLPHQQAYKSTLDALLRIFREEGISGLYAGLGSGLLGTVVSAFSYFYLYSTIRGNYLKRIGEAKISTAMELGLGALAGALSQFVVLPIAIITTRYRIHVNILFI